MVQIHVVHRHSTCPNLKTANVLRVLGSVGTLLLICASARGTSLLTGMEG